MEGFIDSSLLIPDRFSKVLRSDSNGRPDHAEPARDLVEEFERPVVNVCLLELKVVLQTGQKMRHCVALLVLSSLLNLDLSNVREGDNYCAFAASMYPRT